MKERLQKLISQAGMASRRDAERLIAEGKVFVNGEPAKIGDKASFSDDIIVDGAFIAKQESTYYLFNKPSGVVTSLKRQRSEKIVTDFFPETPYVFPIGRLDKDTTGTLLMTNDGELANRLAHPKYEITKVYRARINEPLTDEQIKDLNGPIQIDGETSVQTVKKVNNKSYIVILTQGLNHHVKKLFESVERKVISLTRIEFAGLSHVKQLEKGRYRKLKTKEIKWLKSLTDLMI